MIRKRHLTNVNPTRDILGAILFAFQHFSKTFFSDTRYLKIGEFYSACVSFQSNLQFKLNRNFVIHYQFREFKNGGKIQLQLC